MPDDRPDRHAEPRAAGLFAALRATARPVEDRLLVALGDERERQRVVAALSAEGQIVEESTDEAAFERLAEDSFELVVLDLDAVPPGLNAVAAARELRPFADLVFVTAADAHVGGEAFAAEVAALLPRPLPETDALLRAHMRWLASSRRARSRGLLLRNALVRHRDELLAVEPALAHALSEIAADLDQRPRVTVLGHDPELAGVAGAVNDDAEADVVLVPLEPSHEPDPRLREARQRARMAAPVVVDRAPTPARMSAAVYGGARAYLGRAEADLGHLGRVVASIGQRRRAEVCGRRLLETLARFGVLDETESSPVRVTPRDVDVRLLAHATNTGAVVVPSGHEVLVVDDEVVVLTVLREALRRGGYKVTTAASAEEAIDLMRRRRFDLVLTDKNLPGASGLEVLRVARSLTPPPAVVLVTGYSSYDSAALALDIGAHDYIEKPIRDLENLRFRIRRALSRRDEHMAQAPSHDVGKIARVLLVEIEGTRRQLLSEFLGRGYHVTAVADGDEALALLQRERYDVVLADRNLPGMSGLRVIEQAQRLLPHCASVLYTAYPSYDSVKEAFELGVDAFCVRPSDDLKSLAEKVAGALRSRGILLG